MKAAGIGLSRMTRKQSRILKTDLWEEAIARDRSVLSGLSSWCGEDSEIMGMDISDEICHRVGASRYLTYVLQGDVRSIPLGNGSVDLVLDLSTLDHVNANEAPRVLEEYGRVLARGGVLVLLFVHESGLSRLRSALFGMTERGGALREQYYLPVATITESVSRHLVIKEEYRIFLPWIAGTWNASLDLFLGRLPRSLYDFLLGLQFTRFSRYFPYLLPASYLVLATKG